MFGVKTIVFETKKNAALAVAGVLLAGSLISCSQKELVRPDAVLINRGNNFYARERFTQAAEEYRKSIEENPDSPFRKAAILGLADSLYKDRKYFEAALYYERFVELYPMDPLRPRAVFYLGMCHYLDSYTPDRDQTPTKKAMETFDSFVKDYPNSELAPYARKFYNEMRATLAESLLEIARYYYKVNQNQAAIGRIHDFLNQYPDAETVPEAMYMLGVCYYREQSFRKAAVVFTELMKKFPENKYAAEGAAIAEKLRLKG